MLDFLWFEKMASQTVNSTYTTKDIKKLAGLGAKEHEYLLRRLGIEGDIVPLRGQGRAQKFSGWVIFIILIAARLKQRGFAIHKVKQIISIMQGLRANDKLNLGKGEPVFLHVVGNKQGDWITIANTNTLDLGAFSRSFYSLEGGEKKGGKEVLEDLLDFYALDLRRFLKKLA